MSYDIVQEDVPSFVRRVGDHVIQGSNNTIIVLGTDRARPGPASIDDGLGHIGSPEKGVRSGAVHIIAGRRDPKGDPDLIGDSAYLYLSMKSDVDKNIQLGGVLGDSGRMSAAIVKADAVRIIVRKDLKISLDGGSTYIVLSKDRIVLEGKKIEFGNNAKKHLMRYEDFQLLYDNHAHPTGVGLSGVPIPPNAATQRQKLATLSPNEILVSG